MKASRAEALRALADLLRSGLSMRAGLVSWHEEIDADELRTMSRVIRLGATPATALERVLGDWGEDAERLTLIVSLTMRMGGNGAVMLERLAAGIEDREASTRGGRAAAAGAVLSGRMVAGLPLAFLPLTPMARAPLFDGPGLVLLACGIAFAVAGMSWIRRMVPRPPGEDTAGTCAELTAALVGGGVPLAAALDEVAGLLRAPAFRDVRRLVRLGATWAAALTRSGDAGLVGLASTIERAEQTGTPIEAALLRFARRRRRDLQLEFEASTKKAPVGMVVPLVLCVLPSFCLLALAPFLRGLALAG